MDKYQKIKRFLTLSAHNDAELGFAADSFYELEMPYGERHNERWRGIYMSEYNLTKTEMRSMEVQR